jgi:NTE family protein
VIRELQRLGIEPDVVGGTSAGALVGAIYLCGGLDWFEEWLRGLGRREIVRRLDLTLLGGGGLVEGKRLMEFLRERLGDPDIETLPKPFAAVAADLGTGRELWLREGPVLAAVRASMALPGLFTPVEREGRWLVDGGLVNPVPVSVCRALGAEVVIAVNVNSDLLERRQISTEPPRGAHAPPAEGASFLDRFAAEVRSRAADLAAHFFGPDGAPGLLDVMAGAINIMQERITRSRMSGDPAEVLLEPHLAQLGLLEFDRAEEAIEAGRRCAEHSASTLLEAAGLAGRGQRREEREDYGR